MGDEACKALSDVKRVNAVYIGEWALGGTATNYSTFARAKRTVPCTFVAKNIELHLRRPVEATTYFIELSYTPPFPRTGKLCNPTSLGGGGVGCSVGQFSNIDDLIERPLVQVRLKVWALTLGMETEALDSEGLRHMMEVFSNCLVARISSANEQGDTVESE